ncbi:hypothetical protein APSETT444_000192 [Aspergillus pseudonomiae]
MFRFVEYTSAENDSGDHQIQPSLPASNITFISENNADFDNNGQSNSRPADHSDYQQSFQYSPSQVPTSYPVGSQSLLSPLKKREQSIADEYQQYCLESLISALDDSQKTLDESLFASAVILRLSEEMTEPSPREVVDSHTLSAHILVRIKEGNICTSSFTDAALIVVLRQEIFVANLTQRPVGSFTDHCNIDTSLGPTSESMWTYRIIAHAAKITDFVYGDVIFRTKDRWNDLMQYVQGWEDSRPNSFMPIYSETKNPPSSCFPKIWYCNDCHVAARLYLELCRILLLASDPDATALRIGRLRRMQDNDDKIRECVRVICGVALTNPEFHTTRSIAGLAIGLCGELFHDPRETKVLLDLLSAAELHLGWPCLKLKEDLRRFWRLPVVES